MMTRAQVDGILSAWRGHIAEWKTRLLPTAGRAVQASGRMVTVEPLPPPPERALPPPPTWQVLIYGRLRQFGLGISEYSGEWSGWTDAAGVYRSNGIFWSNYFWESTQYHHITGPVTEGFEPYGREIEVEFQIRSSAIAGAGLTPDPFEEALFRIPGVLTLQEVRRHNGQIVEVVRTHEIVLRRDGATMRFTPPETNQLYELNPISLTRL